MTDVSQQVENGETVICMNHNGVVRKFIVPVNALPSKSGASNDLPPIAEPEASKPSTPAATTAAASFPVSHSKQRRRRNPREEPMFARNSVAAEISAKKSKTDTSTNFEEALAMVHRIANDLKKTRDDEITNEVNSQNAPIVIDSCNEIKPQSSGHPLRKSTSSSVGEYTNRMVKSSSIILEESQYEKIRENRIKSKVRKSPAQKEAYSAMVRSRNREDAIKAMAQQIEASTPKRIENTGSTGQSASQPIVIGDSVVSAPRVIQPAPSTPIVVNKSINQNIFLQPSIIGSQTNMRSPAQTVSVAANATGLRQTLILGQQRNPTPNQSLILTPDGKLVYGQPSNIVQPPQPIILGNQMMNTISTPSGQTIITGQSPQQSIITGGQTSNHMRIVGQPINVTGLTGQAVNPTLVTNQTVNNSNTVQGSYNQPVVLNNSGGQVANYINQCLNQQVLNSLTGQSMIVQGDKSVANSGATLHTDNQFGSSKVIIMQASQSNNSSSPIALSNQNHQTSAKYIVPNSQMPIIMTSNPGKTNNLITRNSQQNQVSPQIQGQQNASPASSNVLSGLVNIGGNSQCIVLAPSSAANNPQISASSKSVTTTTPKSISAAVLPRISHAKSDAPIVHKNSSATNGANLAGSQDTEQINEDTEQSKSMPVAIPLYSVSTTTQANPNQTVLASHVGNQRAFKPVITNQPQNSHIVINPQEDVGQIANQEYNNAALLNTMGQITSQFVNETTEITAELKQAQSDIGTVRPKQNDSGGDDPSILSNAVANLQNAITSIINDHRSDANTGARKVQTENNISEVVQTTPTSNAQPINIQAANTRSESAQPADIQQNNKSDNNADTPLMMLDLEGKMRKIFGFTYLNNIRHAVVQGSNGFMALPVPDPSSLNETSAEKKSSSTENPSDKQTMDQSATVEQIQNDTVQVLMQSKLTRTDKPTAQKLGDVKTKSQARRKDVHSDKHKIRKKYQQPVVVLHDLNITNKAARFKIRELNEQFKSITKCKNTDGIFIKMKLQPQRSHIAQANLYRSKIMNHFSEVDHLNSFVSESDEKISSSRFKSRDITDISESLREEVNSAYHSAYDEDTDVGESDEENGLSSMVLSPCKNGYSSDSDEKPPRLEIIGNLGTVCSPEHRTPPQLEIVGIESESDTDESIDDKSLIDYLERGSNTKDKFSKTEPVKDEQSDNQTSGVNLEVENQVVWWKPSFHPSGRPCWGKASVNSKGVPETGAVSESMKQALDSTFATFLATDSPSVIDKQKYFSSILSHFTNKPMIMPDKKGRDLTRELIEQRKKGI